MAILMASSYSPCPFIFFCKPSAPCWGARFPFKCCFWKGRSSRQQTWLLPLTHLCCCQKDKAPQARQCYSCWTGHFRQAWDAGTSHPRLQSSLKLFPLVFFSLANGHWPWAGFRQVIYVFSSLNKWPCLKVRQMEGEKKIQASIYFGQAKICS